MYLKLPKCLPYLKQKFTVLHPIELYPLDEFHQRVRDYLFLGGQQQIDYDVDVLQSEKDFVFQVSAIDDYILIEYIIGELLKALKSHIKSYMDGHIILQKLCNENQPSESQVKSSLKQLKVIKDKLVKGILKFRELIEKLELYNIEFDLKQLYIGEDGLLSVYKYAWEIDLLLALSKLKNTYSQPKLTSQELLYEKRVEVYMMMIEEVIYGESKTIINEYSKQLYIIPDGWGLQMIEKRNISDLLPEYKSADSLLNHLVTNTKYKSMKQFKTRMIALVYLQLEEHFFEYVKFLKMVLLNKVSNFLNTDYETWHKLYEISLKIYSRKEDARAANSIEIDQLLQSQSQNQQFLQFILTCDLKTVSLSSMNFFFKNSPRQCKEKIRPRILMKLQQIMADQPFNNSEDVFEYLENQATCEQRQGAMKLYCEIIHQFIKGERKLVWEDSCKIRKLFEDLSYFSVKFYEDNGQFLKNLLSLQMLEDIVKKLDSNQESPDHKMDQYFVYTFINTLLISCYEEEIQYKDSFNEQDRQSFRQLLQKTILLTVSGNFVYHEDIYGFLSEFMDEDDQQLQDNPQFQKIVGETISLMLITGKQCDYKLENFYFLSRKQEIANQILQVFKALASNQLFERKQIDRYLKSEDKSSYSQIYVKAYINMISLKNKLIFENLLNFAVKISPELPFIESIIYAIDFFGVLTPSECSDKGIDFLDQEISMLDTIASENPIQCLKMIYKKMNDYNAQELTSNLNEDMDLLLYKYFGRQKTSSFINKLVCPQEKRSTVDMIDIDNISQIKRFCLMLKLMTILFGKLNEKTQKNVKEIKIIYDTMGTEAIKICKNIYTKFAKSQVQWLHTEKKRLCTLIEEHQKFFTQGISSRQSFCLEDVKEILLGRFSKQYEIPIVDNCIIKGNYILETIQQFLGEIGKVLKPDCYQNILQELKIQYFDLPESNGNHQSKDQQFFKYCIIMINAIENSCVETKDNEDPQQWVQQLLRLTKKLQVQLPSFNNEESFDIVSRTLCINLKAEIIKLLIPHLIKSLLKSTNNFQTYSPQAFELYEKLCEIIQKISPGQQDHILVLLEIVQEQSGSSESSTQSKTNSIIAGFLMRAVESLMKLVFKGIRVRSYHLYKFMKKYTILCNQNFTFFNTVVSCYINRLFKGFIPQFQLPQAILKSCDQSLLKIKPLETITLNKKTETSLVCSLQSLKIANQYNRLTNIYTEAAPSQIKIKKDLKPSFMKETKQSQSEDADCIKFRTKRKKSVEYMKQSRTLIQNSNGSPKLKFETTICTLSMLLNLFCRLNYKSLVQGIPAIWNTDRQILTYLRYLVQITPLVSKSMEETDKRDQKLLDIINIDCYGNMQLIVGNNSNGEILVETLELCKAVVSQKPSSLQNSDYKHTMKSRISNSLKQPLKILSRQIQRNNQQLIHEINKIKLSPSQQQKGDNTLNTGQLVDLLDLFITSFQVQFQQGIISNLLINNLNYLLLQANPQVKQRILQRNYRQLKAMNVKNIAQIAKKTNQAFIPDAIEIRMDSSCEKLVDSMVDGFVYSYFEVFGLNIQGSNKVININYGSKNAEPDFQRLFLALKMLSVSLLNNPELLVHLMQARPYALSGKYQYLSIYDIMEDCCQKSVEIFSALYALFIKNNISFNPTNEKVYIPFSLELQKSMKACILTKIRAFRYQEQENNSLEILLQCAKFIEENSYELRLRNYHIPKIYNEEYNSLVTNEETIWRTQLMEELYLVFDRLTVQRETKTYDAALTQVMSIMGILYSRLIPQITYEHLKIKLEKDLWENTEEHNKETLSSLTQRQPLKPSHPSLAIISSDNIRHTIESVNKGYQCQDLGYEILPQQCLNYLIKTNLSSTSNTEQNSFSRRFVKMEMEFLGNCAIKQMESIDRLYDQMQINRNQFVSESQDDNCEDQICEDKICEDGICEDGICDDVIMYEEDQYIIGEVTEDGCSFGQIPESQGNIDTILEPSISQSGTSLQQKNLYQFSSQIPRQVQGQPDHKFDKQHLMNLLEDSSINPESLKQLLSLLPLTPMEQLFKFHDYLEKSKSLLSQNSEQIESCLSAVKKELIKQGSKSITFEPSVGGESKEKKYLRLRINEQEIYKKMSTISSAYHTKSIPHLTKSSIDYLHQLCYTLYKEIKQGNVNQKQHSQRLKGKQQERNSKQEKLDCLISLITKYFMITKHNYTTTLSYYLKVMSHDSNTLQSMFIEESEVKEYGSFLLNIFITKMIENKLGLAAIMFGQFSRQNETINVKNVETEQSKYIINELLCHTSIFSNNLSRCQKLDSSDFIKVFKQYLDKVTNNSIWYKQQIPMTSQYPYYELQEQRSMQKDDVSKIVENIYQELNQSFGKQGPSEKKIINYIMILLYLDPKFFAEFYESVIERLSDILAERLTAETVIFKKFTKRSSRIQKKPLKEQMSNDKIDSQSEISELSQQSQHTFKNKEELYRQEERFWSYRTSCLRNKQNQPDLEFGVYLLNILNAHILPIYKKLKFQCHYQEPNLEYMREIQETTKTLQSKQKNGDPSKKMAARLQDLQGEYQIWKKCSFDALYNDQVLPVIEEKSHKFSQLLLDFENYITDFMDYFKKPEQLIKQKNNSVFDNPLQQPKQEENQSIIYEVCAKFYEIILASELLTSSTEQYNYHTMSKLKTLKSVQSFASGNLTRKSTLKRSSHKLSISPVSFKMSMSKPEHILKRIGQSCSSLYNYLGPSLKIKQIHTKYSKNTNKIKYLWEKDKPGNSAEIEKTIECRREFIVEDSMSAIDDEFIKADSLKIKFEGEIGIDYGGVTREWITLLIKNLINPDFGLFSLSANGLTVQPNKNSFIIPNHLMYFQKMGILVGKAMQSNWLLQLNFTKSFLKHLLGSTLYVEDLEDIDPDTAKSLIWILKTQIEEDDLGINFVYQRELCGQKSTEELVEGGNNILINQENKKQYIKLLASKQMTQCIREQSKAFMRGLESIIPYSTLQLYSYKEISLYLSGVPKVNLPEMRKYARYQGYTLESQEIVWFWEILEDWENNHNQCDSETLENFLFFLTGSYKVPYGGFQEHPIGLNKMAGCRDYLPVAHTCFSVIDLPEFSTKKKMQNLLLKAIQEGKGFSVS